MKNNFIKSLILTGILMAQVTLPIYAENVKGNDITQEKEDVTEIEVLENNEKEKPTSAIITNAKKKKTVDVDIYIGNVGNFKLSKATFAIYNKDLEYITQKEILIENTNVYQAISFDVSEYTPGEVFYLSCIEGLDCVRYYDNYYGVNHTIKLETFYDCIDEETGEIIDGGHFSISAYPLAQRDISLALNGYKRSLKFPIKLDESTSMISFPDLVSLLGLDSEQYVYNSETGEIALSLNDKGIILFIGRNEAYIKEETISVTAPRIIDGIIYLPVRAVTEGLGATLNVEMKKESMKIDVSIPFIKYTEKNKFINSKGITSRTNYLLWVSKSQFCVTVFVKTSNGWEAIREMPCTIGKPSTPTITGQFEYFSKEKRWTYPKYYVGPIMRFYRGYAFHSTLIKYDGTPYDGRVGKQLSLGCVRMRPEDINWMVDAIPLYTKVYITE